MTASSHQSRSTAGVCRRMMVYLGSFPAIDTHDHLHPYAMLSRLVETERGPGMNLYGVLANSYIFWAQPCPVPWRPGMAFREWWAQIKKEFEDIHTLSVFRYMLPAFKDLYGVDFEKMTDAQAARLDRRIFENYQREEWIRRVVVERCNIERMFIDPIWRYGDFERHYPFQVPVARVDHFIYGHHPSVFTDSSQPDLFAAFNPYDQARRLGLPMKTLADYERLIEAAVIEAKARGAAVLKQARAYVRTIDFENVSRERAARAFGRPAGKATPAEIKDFQDYVMWRLVELSARHDIPFQIHTGPGRLEGSSPLLLVKLIEANPATKFILFHGGYPWVSETAAIAFRFPNNVWIDSVWLPTISYSAAKRAFHEWLETVKADRIMWGSDALNAEGIYGATVITRRCLAEVLAEKIAQGDLDEARTRVIGRQILRDNALKLFPQLARGD